MKFLLLFTINLVNISELPLQCGRSTQKFIKTDGKFEYILTIFTPSVKRISGLRGSIYEELPVYPFQTQGCSLT